MTREKEGHQLYIENRPAIIDTGFLFFTTYLCKVVSMRRRDDIQTIYGVACEMCCVNYQAVGKIFD